MFSVTNEELEDNADVVKVAVLSALVKDDLLASDVAEKWAEEHTVLHRKKSFFRTLTDKWRKEKTEPSQYYYLVVVKR